MTDETIDLDQHRGMTAQKATDLCRLLADTGATAPGVTPKSRPTPEEAEPLSSMLSTYLKTVETVDIDRRLRDVENKMTDRK